MPPTKPPAADPEIPADVQAKIDLLIEQMASDDTDVPGGSVSVSMAGGTPGQFKSEPLPNPIELAAGQTYYLVSQETNLGDEWHDVSTTLLTSTDVATIDSGVFGWSGGEYVRRYACRVPLVVCRSMNT